MPLTPSLLTCSKKEIIDSAFSSHSTCKTVAGEDDKVEEEEEEEEEVEREEEEDSSFRSHTPMSKQLS